MVSAFVYSSDIHVRSDDNEARPAAAIYGVAVSAMSTSSSKRDTQLGIDCEVYREASKHVRGPVPSTIKPMTKNSRKGGTYKVHLQ